jgi:hypothetical protein
MPAVRAVSLPFRDRVSVSPPTQRLAPSSAFLPRLILLAVAINLVATAIAFLSLYHSREQTVEQVRLTTANLAALAENNLSESARRIDLALIAIVDRMEHQLAQGRLTDAVVGEVLATYLARLPEVDAFRAGLSDGVVRWGKGVDPAKPASYADRAFFAAHRADPGQRLIVTEPIVGRVSKKWVVAFTRSYRKPDGSFGGVVTAAVPVDFFTRMLGEMKLGPNGSAVIRHFDRSLLTRHPPVDGPGGSHRRQNRVRHLCRAACQRRGAGELSRRPRARWRRAVLCLSARRWPALCAQRWHGASGLS